MTETLLSLLSISFGILGANIFSYYFKKYSFGLTGNTLIGVFGSAFFIKTLGRIGFSPFHIVNVNKIDFLLLFINLIISVLGGIFALYIIYRFKNLMKGKSNTTKN